MALYGITHSLAGKPLVRLAKTLKVGIGYPKGPAVHTYIDKEGKWKVEVGTGRETVRKAYATKAEAQEAYNTARKAAPERKYPGKFGYFTFQRIGIDGSFTPDWDAIELHGAMPNEIGIVFLDNRPLHQQMEWWSSAELKCSGDGKDASRRNTNAQNPEEQRLAEKSAKAGEQFFPIVGGCFAMGCPFGRGDKPVCKPHTRLSFQLVNAPALGSTVVYDSTGFRSATQLFSSLEQIRTLTGRGNPEEGTVAGIPLTLKLLPYRTSHNGQPSTQFGVTLHLRASDALTLMRSTLGHADEFRQISDQQLMLGEAQELPRWSKSDLKGEVLLTEAGEAAALSAEFYPEEDEPTYEEAPPEPYEEPPPEFQVPPVPQPRQNPLRRKPQAGMEPVGNLLDLIPPQDEPPGGE